MDIKKRKIKKLTALQVAEYAVEAMLEEVVTEHKPGLVTPSDNRCHPDMNVSTFIKSAVTMQPYFVQCFEAGSKFNGDDLTQLFQKIRPYGMQAEKRMFEVTQGVNTHKGCVFILGIVTAALGYCSRMQSASLEDLQQIIKKMMDGIVQSDLAHISTEKLTAGEKQFQKYGLTGIRGEAQAGFSLVFETSLSVYEDSNLKQNDRKLLALMSLVAKNDDSNLIKRADYDFELVHEVQNSAQGIVDFYQEKNKIDRKSLDKLIHLCLEHHLSLGGSADLLGLTIFLGKITKRLSN